MTQSLPQRTRQYRLGYGPGTTTAVVRTRDPLRQVAEMYDLMNQLMQDFVGEPGGAMPFAVPADLEESDEAYLVEIDIPGVSPDDIDISLRENELRVTGESKERERKGILRRRARRAGQFELMMTLPGPVDPDKVDARLHDGVLTITLRKAQTSRERHIEVHNSRESAAQSQARER